MRCTLSQSYYIKAVRWIENNKEWLAGASKELIIQEIKHEIPALKSFQLLIKNKVLNCVNEVARRAVNAALADNHLSIYFKI